jgi:uncharacterized membrane protein
MDRATRWHNAYRWINLGALCALLILVSLLHLATVPTESPDVVVLGKYVLPSMCVVSRVIGRPCPGCGVTRSLVLLFNGHLDMARAMHPSGMWIGAWIILQAGARLSMFIWYRCSRRSCLVDAIVSGATLIVAEIAPVALSGSPG